MPMSHAPRSAVTVTGAALPPAGPTSALTGDTALAPSTGAFARPLRLQVFSDLHADVADGRDPVVVPGIDAVVVAGDTCRGPARAFAFLRGIVPAHVAIVATLGNHEHYRAMLPETLDAARRAAVAHDVAFLEDGTAVIAGCRFVGCALWTDYRLYGTDAAADAMAAAAARMNDHRLIGVTRDPWRPFRPADAAEIHRASRAYLESTLAKPFDGPTVVVTHHAPHAGSVHPKYGNAPLNAAFASDLSALIERGEPTLWVHGHVHSSHDYRVGRTRVVCNPRGYGGENPAFDPALMVEVPR